MAQERLEIQLPSREKGQMRKMIRTGRRSGYDG